MSIHKKALEQVILLLAEVDNQVVYRAVFKALEDSNVEEEVGRKVLKTLQDSSAKNFLNVREALGWVTALKEDLK